LEYIFKSAMTWWTSKAQKWLVPINFRLRPNLGCYSTPQTKGSPKTSQRGNFLSQWYMVSMPTRLTDKCWVSLEAFVCCQSSWNLFQMFSRNDHLPQRLKFTQYNISRTRLNRSTIRLLFSIA
jgi:hypothetical protein